MKEKINKFQGYKMRFKHGSKKLKNCKDLVSFRQRGLVNYSSRI